MLFVGNGVNEEIVELVALLVDALGVGKFDQ